MTHHIDCSQSQPDDAVSSKHAFEMPWVQIPAGAQVYGYGSICFMYIGTIIPFWNVPRCGTFQFESVLLVLS